ncbi:cyclase family protein [Streptomyces sp. NBC_01619]|uniref:Cyclase family protein n=1 Tax=Streptomyces pratisoli TaxID=3139917 RepID=A0ACC6QR71_9ACTN|nr:MULTISPECIES: cyclase family protein [unclassified Streptomyces]MCX4514653.1 cyclase family protein [Streptomyces sp. NBC_01619]
MSAEAFRTLYDKVRERTRHGPDDRRGTLNHLTPARVVAAAREVMTGRTVSLAAPVATLPGPDNPDPARHRMTAPGPGDDHSEGLGFALDRFAMNVHGDVDSHLDALCHVMYDGALYNGVPADSVTPQGATELTVDVVRDGVVGRGVLLDIPRLRGVRWLEPGDHVTAGDLAAAEAAQGVRTGPGDILLVRVGHRRRRRESGPWNAAEARAGLHPEAVEFLADRQVALLGSDGNNDTAPSAVEGVDFPVHVLAVQAMGMHLMDYLQFEELAPACEQEGRWSFLCVVAPLRLPEATGSPVNPIAVL